MLTIHEHDVIIVNVGDVVFSSDHGTRGAARPSVGSSVEFMWRETVVHA